MTRLEFNQIAPDDIALFRALMQLFSDAFDEPENYAEKPPSDDYVRTLLAKDHFIALVALKDEKVIGGLVAYELEKFEQQRSEIYIYDLAVSEQQRRKKVATGLIEHLEELAKIRSAGVIFVQAGHGDDPAIALYESQGEREPVLHFDIPVH